MIQAVFTLIVLYGVIYSYQCVTEHSGDEGEILCIGGGEEFLLINRSPVSARGLPELS